MITENKGTEQFKPATLVGLVGVGRALAGVLAHGKFVHAHVPELQVHARQFLTIVSPVGESFLVSASVHGQASRRTHAPGSRERIPCQGSASI